MPNSLFHVHKARLWAGLLTGPSQLWGGLTTVSFQLWDGLMTVPLYGPKVFHK